MAAPETKSFCITGVIRGYVEGRADAKREEVGAGMRGREMEPGGHKRPYRIGCDSAPLWKKKSPLH